MTNLKQKVEEKILFSPVTEEEKAHLVRITNILKLKRRGDWQAVAEMVSLLPANAEKSFKRVHSVNHKTVVNALEKVIESRQQFLAK